MAFPSCPYSPECVEGVSLLKTPFAPSSAPGSGAEEGVLVVFRPCFRALLECRPGRHLLFQQAGVFYELRLYGVLRSSSFWKVKQGAKA